ncbi:hypothetical protein BY996DRAFT_7253058 [Phakopsora pachyrhizi]|nr:hypothetical protein BY996DRAFT_7253058 [Phakopsora pachyrhizi]
MDESDFMTANAVDAIQQAQNQGNNSSIQQQANHRRSSSFKLTRVLSRKSSSKSSRKNKNRPIINTLPIIQPQPYWNYSGPGSRVFKINLHNPRQQVTSLLALSSVPRPVTPPHEEFESSSTLISNATRAAIEEEETRAAIAASLITFASQNASNFSSSETDTCEEEDDFLDTIPVLPRGTQTFHHSRVLTSLSSSVPSNEMVNDSGNVSGLSTREQQSPNSFHSAAAVSIIHQPSSNSLVLGNDPTIGSIQDADELSDGMGYLRMGRRRRASQVEAASAGSSSSSSSSSASGTVPVTLAGDELHSSSSISSLRNSLISTTSGRSSSSSVMSNICDICQSCKTYASECHAQLTKPLSQPLGVGAPAPTQTPTPGQPGVGPAGGRRSLGSRGPAPVENHRPRMRSQPSEGTSKTRNCSTTATTTTTTTATSNNSYLSKVSKSLAGESIFISVDYCCYHFVLLNKKSIKDFTDSLNCYTTPNRYQPSIKAFKAIEPNPTITTTQGEFKPMEKHPAGSTCRS